MVNGHSKHALRGRRRECETLDRVLQEARSGQSSVLVLSGEAGIGKSALLDYLAARASGCRVGHLTGIESEVDLAFSGLHRLCGSMLDELDRLPDPQRIALRTVFGLEAGPPPDHFLVGLAVLGLLAAVTEDGPVVWIVDDAQWLDDATGRVLAFVAHRLLAEPLALVFAVREPGGQDALADLPQLRVEGLGHEDALALLDSVITVRLDDRVRDRLVAETRGNPLALLELPQWLTPAELQLGRFGSADHGAMASRMEEGFLRQLQDLPVDTRRLLLTAALEPLGDVTLLWRAVEQLGIDSKAAASAEEVGLITLRGRVRFRHPLVRSAVFRTASVTEVRAAHRALAEATDPIVDADRRTWHRAQAVADSDESVARELELAAVRANKRGALVMAGAFLQRAAELTPDPARRGTRALTAAGTKVFVNEPESALELLATAQLCPLDALQHAWALVLRASLPPAYYRHVSEQPQMFLDAAQTFHAVDARTARETYFCVLATQIPIGRLAGAERLREVALAARRAPPAPNAPRTIDLVLDAVAIRFAEGHAPGLDPARRALDACAEERDHGREFLQWLWCAPLLGPEIWDDEGWDRVTANVVRLNRDAGAINVLPVSLQYRAEFELQAGKLASAAALIDESDMIMELTNRHDSIRTAPELAAWRGDDAALERLSEVEKVWTGFGYGHSIGFCAYAKAVLFNGRGDYDDAAAAARRACEFDDFGVYGRALVEYVEAASRGGARAEADAALRQLEARALASGTDWALGILARSRALLSENRGAESLYREAIERLGQTRMAAHLARAHLVYGEWLRRANRRVDAREQLRRAHEMLTGFGAAAFAERARRELLATGEKVRKRSVDTTDALTPQEAQIARLVSDGESNPEIGSRLFISPRTVEYHLSKVFVKLGVKNRRELRSALRS